MKVGKSEALCCYTFLVGLFWAVCQRSGAFRSFDDRSQLGFIIGVEWSPVEVSVCQAAAWVGRTEALKLTNCCYYLQLCCSSEPLLEDFSAMAGFYNGGSRMGYVPGCEEDPMNVVA